MFEYWHATGEVDHMVLHPHRVSAASPVEAGDRHDQLGPVRMRGRPGRTRRPYQGVLRRRALLGGVVCAAAPAHRGHRAPPARLSMIGGPDEAALVCQHHCLHAVAQVELGEHARNVRLDRRRLDNQLLGDLGIG